jgi:hypothetical protein
MNHIKTTPVSRVKSISKEDFIKHYYKPQRPVLIESLTKDWPAFEKWNLNYIQQLSGDQVVPLYNNEPAKGKQSVYEPVKKLKLYDYIEILKT